MDLSQCRWVSLLLSTGREPFRRDGCPKCTSRNTEAVVIYLTNPWPWVYHKCLLSYVAMPNFYLQVFADAVLINFVNDGLCCQLFVTSVSSCLGSWWLESFLRNLSCFRNATSNVCCSLRVSPHLWAVMPVTSALSFAWEAHSHPPFMEEEMKV